MEDNYSLDICAHTVYNFEIIEMDLVGLFHAINWLSSYCTCSGIFHNKLSHMVESSRIPCQIRVGIF